MSEKKLKPKIVVTQPVHEDVLTRLKDFGDVVVNPGPEPWSEAALREHLSNADGMIAFMPDRVDRKTLELAPRLRTVACALKGFDNFDLAACREAGVVVTFVPDLLTEPTAELAIGLAIAAGRHVLRGDAMVRTGEFSGWRPVLYGTGLHGSVVAVAGLGAVGKAIVDRLQGFGCAEILGVDPSGVDPRVRLVSLEEAARKADYLLLAVPLLPNSVHLVGRAIVEAAKPNQLIVNIGRGSVVDESAIVDGLESGKIGAYAADVFEMEDWLLPNRPSGISPRLLACERTVFTPHIGSAVSRVRRAIEHRAVDNLISVLTGLVPRDVLEITC
jgi:phosphonate dehydrogenase